MLSAIPYAFAALFVIGSWVTGLAYFDFFTPDDVKAWRRLANLRGYATPRGRIEKLATSSTFVRRVQEELDLTRLLAIVGRDETPLGFLGRCAAISLGGASGGLVFEFIYKGLFGDWILGVGPWIVFLFGILVFFAVVSNLRNATKKVQDDAGRALGDMLMLVAIMTDGRGLQLEDSVRILSRCVDTESLETIVDKRGWQRLIKEPYTSTIDLFRMIGDEYRIPQFLQIADAASNANVGFSERETYTRLAKAVYAHRLADARQKAARAKILVTIPVAGMLIPLLVLLGAPTFASITNGLTGGH